MNIYTVLIKYILAIIFVIIALLFNKFMRGNDNPHVMKNAHCIFFRLSGSAVLYLAFLPTAAFGIFNIANGVLLTVGGYLFFVPELKRLAYRLFPKAAKKVITGVWSFFFIGLTTALSLLILLLCGTSPQPVGTEKTVVVLGCLVKGDEPSLALSYRIEAAAEYMEKHPDTVCIASGGKGNGENITEAQCIYNGLTEKGISPDRIILEEASSNTNENFKFTAAIINDKGLDKNIVIITDAYHQYRSGLYAEKYGLGATKYSVHAPFELQEIYWVREMIGLVKFILE